MLLPNVLVIGIVSTTSLGIPTALITSEQRITKALTFEPRGVNVFKKDTSKAEPINGYVLGVNPMILPKLLFNICTLGVLGKDEYPTQLLGCVHPIGREEGGTCKIS